MTAQAVTSKLGQKETSIGALPEHWLVLSIGELAQTYSGGTPSTSVPSYYGGEIAWITSGDLNQTFIDNVNGRISPLGLKHSSAKMVAPGMVLMALYGATAGVVAITKIRAAVNQAVLAIVPKEMVAEYLFYALAWRQSSIVKTFTQGGQPNLSGQMIRSLLVAVPPLPEQRAIAQILTDMDAEITALEKRLAKTKDIKQGMMQELLTGRTRLV